MIKQLSIKNFKSIRELDLSCRRVNVFIGEPNVGKTNILEALALRCAGCLSHFCAVQRVTSATDLHFDLDVSNSVEVRIDRCPLVLRLNEDGVTGVFRLANGGGEQAFKLTTSLEVQPNTIGLQNKNDPIQVRYYLFTTGAREDSSEHGPLLPPFGENIVSLLYSSKAARQSASQFFQATGFKLSVEFAEKRLRVAKEVDDLFVAFPYASASETLRRMVFVHLALDTNRDQVLVFDEPEAHAYPPFTKRLAERIALDDRGNQFFLTTHSPYMLDSLLAKTPADDLNIVLCRMENFETKAYPLNAAQKAKLMEWSMDAFFNFDRLLDTDA